MSRFEEFWLNIGDRIKIATPVEERSLAVRRVLAARAFERWRLGKLTDEQIYAGRAHGSAVLTD